MHTADDIETSGPDAVSGWGLLNTKKAAETISDNGIHAIIEERTLNSGGSYRIYVRSDGQSPLMASISWTDPLRPINPGIANNTTPVLVNDLDIRVTKGTATYSPYKLTSVSTNSTREVIE